MKNTKRSLALLLALCMLISLLPAMTFAAEGDIVFDFAGFVIEKGWTKNEGRHTQYLADSMDGLALSASGTGATTGLLWETETNPKSIRLNNTKYDWQTQPRTGTAIDENNKVAFDFEVETAGWYSPSIRVVQANKPDSTMSLYHIADGKATYLGDAKAYATTTLNAVYLPKGKNTIVLAFVASSNPNNEAYYVSNITFAKLSAEPTATLQTEAPATLGSNGKAEGITASLSMSDGTTYQFPMYGMNATTYQSTGVDESNYLKVESEDEEVVTVTYKKTNATTTTYTVEAVADGETNLVFTPVIGGVEQTAFKEPVKVQTEELLSIELSAGRTTVEVGGTTNLSVVANWKLSEDADVANKDVEFSVSPEGSNVVSVSEEGVVTAKSEGTATITATYEGKSDSVEITVEEDKLSSIELTADKAEIFIGATANLSVVANWSVTGEKAVANSDVEFTPVPADAVSIENGIVKGVKEDTVTITATYNGKSDTVEIKVTEVPDPMEHEFVLGLNAFNKANMITGTKFSAEPVLRDTANGAPSGLVLYFTPAMHWDYNIQAEFAADGKEFKAMDLTKTNKWAFDSLVKTKSGPILYDNNFHLEFKYANYADKTTPAVVAFKIVPEVAGEYHIRIKGPNAAACAVPAVYFFKNGQTGVVNNKPSTYPQGSKIGYFNAPKAGGEYAHIGTVTIDEPGVEYIIAFHGDQTSAEMNKTLQTNDDVQNLKISGIKLVPEADDMLDSISVSAKSLVAVGDTTKLSVKAVWTASGEVDLVPENVTFSVNPEGSNVVSVAKDGTVTGLAPGKATVTAKYGDKSDTVEITVAVDELLSIELSANEKEIYIGESANLSVVAKWTVSGEKAVDPKDVTFTADPVDAVSIENGIVKGVEETETVTITATYDGKEASVELAVLGVPEQRLHEFVISQAGLNTDKMVEGKNNNEHATAPVFRQGLGTIHFIKMLHWNYQVPAEYSSDGKAFMALDTTDADGDAKLTDPWAFVSSRATLGQPLLEKGRLAQQFITETYNTAASNYVALELYVEGAGEYDIFGKSTAKDIGAVPAVYFFPKDTANVTLGNASTYPEGSKLGYYNMSKASDYKKIGTVTTADIGNYYIVFQADSASFVKNSKVVNQSGKDYQWFDVAGIKLDKHIDDTVDSIELKASKTLFEPNGTADLSVVANWSKFGELETENADVKFTVDKDGVVEISADGVVTALEVGTVTVTATYEEKSDSVEITVAEDDITSLKLSVENTTLFLGGYTETFAVSATYFISGEKPVANNDVRFTMSEEGIVAISPEGVVTALAAGNVKVTAEYEGVTDTVELTVSEISGLRTHEYIISFEGLNKEKILTMEEYTGKPVIRKASGAIHFAPMLHWNYQVPAEYSSDGKAFMALDTTESDGDAKLTDKWAFVSSKVSLGSPLLESGRLAQQFTTETYNTAASNYVALELYVEGTGEYDLFGKSTATKIGAVPAVYFFPKKTEGVTLGNASTYPAESKLRYYNMATSSKYKKIGTVNIDIPGSYYIVFQADAKSLEENPEVSEQNGKDYQWFDIAGIKLDEHKEDKIYSIELSADKEVVAVNGTANLKPSANWTVSENLPLDPSDVIFTMDKEGIVKISEDGVVTGLDEGTVTITATLKNTELSNTFVITSKFDTFETITLSCDKEVIALGEETATLTLTGKKVVSGTVDVPADAVDFTIDEDGKGVVAVAEDGTVTTIAEGEAKITATLKEDSGIKSSVKVAVEKNILDEIVLEIDRQRIFVENGTKTAALTVWGEMSVTGRRKLSADIANFTASPAGVVEVAEDGTVTAIAPGTATITATLKEDSEQEASVSITVLQEPVQEITEFVTNFAVFNKSGFKTASGYTEAPVLRPENGYFYYTPAMNWEYKVPAEHSANKAEFKAMNLSKTAPWAHEGHKVALGSPFLNDNYFQLEFVKSTYTTASPSYAAFRLKVEASGEYILQAKARAAVDAPVPAVYFFKNGTEGVTNTTVGTYPQTAKLGYYNIPGMNGQYTTLGTINIDVPGEYIISFVGDAESAQRNDVQAGNGAQNFQLEGIKIIPSYMNVATDELILSARNQFVMEGRTMQLDLSRVYTVIGASPVEKYSEYKFESSDESIATVDANGVVTGVKASENPITITVTHNENPNVKATILMKIAPFFEQENYDDKCISIAIDAETNLMYINDEIKLTFSEVWDLSGEKEILDLSTVILASSDESIATVDANGVVKGVKSGEVTITAIRKNTYPEVTASFIVKVFEPKVHVSGKIYTDEMIANARENIREYDWAKSEEKTVIRQADKFLELGAEYIWNMIGGNGLPRAYNVALEINHPTRDPYEMYCRYCNVNLQTKHGVYPWTVNTFTNPWKIKCPECSRSFPSNDFASFYELGRTKENGGLFDRDTALENHRKMLIEKGLLSEEAKAMTSPGSEYTDTWFKYYGYGVKGGYLYNDLYPEVGDPSSGVRFVGENGFQNMSDKVIKENYNPDTIVPETVERWGVDDGHGYATGRTYKNGVKEFHTYIAYFNHFGVWYFGGTGVAASALSNLGKAYMYTGDEKYGRLGAIILDRVADVYPDMSIRYWSGYNPYGRRYPNSTGGSAAGKDLGRIWDCYTAEIYAESHDIFASMYGDAEVIDFLSEKAKYYGMENDKSTALKIRKNIEDGICREIFEACKTAQIQGNFGLHQEALFKAAIALDHKEDTSEMIRWLYATSTGDAATINTGGDVNNKLISKVYRDGMVNESPYYNNLAFADLIDSAAVLERYVENGGEIGEKTLFGNPKYLKSFTAFMPLVSLRRGVPAFADSANPLMYSKLPDVSALKKAIIATRNSTDPSIQEETIKMAQALYMYKGKELKDEHYDIWTKNPENVYEDVMEYINEYGEYNWDKSSIITGYGYAFLRGGTYHDTVGISGVKDTQRDFMLNFSGHNLHNHSDMLDMQIGAYGIPLTYDFGYAEFMVTGDPHSNQLTSATIGHNTVVVDETNQVGSTVVNEVGVPQEPIHFDAKDTRVKVIDARTPTAYAQTEEYRRTIVMVDYDDEISYGVDFFRVDGGNDHLYVFSPSANTRPMHSDNLNFIKQVDEPLDTWKEDRNYYMTSSYAGPTVQFGQDPLKDPSNYASLIYPRGYTWHYDVERCDKPGTGEFWLDWAIKDFKGYSNNPNLDIRLRMTMLNDFNVDEVSLTSLLPQRIKANNMIDHFEKVFVRRKGRKLDSLFTTVYEPYSGERYVANIEKVAIARSGGAEEEKNDVAKAVKVTLKDGRIDYVVYATNRDVIYTITDGDYSFEFSGFVGVWTVNKEGENTYSYLHDGSTLGEGEKQIKNYEAAVTGTVVDFQKEFSLDNWIDVEFDYDMSEEAIADLADRMIVPERETAGTSAYLIEGIEKTGPNTARINLNSTSTVDGYNNSGDPSNLYDYILTGGEKFEIPMSYEDDGAPEFEPIGEKTVSVGSLLTVKVKANPSVEGMKIKYRERVLPRGASFDASTATFSWKPTKSQLGKNLVAIDAEDEVGRVSTIYFTVEVFGSTSGGSSGGGGGGGADVPPTVDPEDPTVEPDEPIVDPEEPTVDPDAPAATKGFTDLGEHAWAEESINALAEAGIIKGTSSSTYSPKNNITRADYAILLVRAFELESEQTENFADVTDADYFAKELAVARNTGIVGGIGDNKYAPRNTITRQDMMVILHRALTKQGVELKPIEGIDVSTYADFEDVADYAQDAVKALVEAGLVNGKGDKLAGSDKTTRAEVAVLLKRILDYIAK